MTEPHVLWLNADENGDPAYHAQMLRQAFAMLLPPGTSDRFGARSGIRAQDGNSSAASVSGRSWQVNPSVAVVSPQVTADTGPYIVTIPETEGSIAASDAANARRDLLYLRVYDDDVDGSGQKRAAIEYRTGTPASTPTRPTTPAGAMPILDILVPSEGSGNPSSTAIYPNTVAAGGVTPVRNANDINDEGAYTGQTIWRSDLGLQMSREGGRWWPTSHCVKLAEQTFSGVVGDGARLTIPPALRGMFRKFEIVIQGGVTRSDWTVTPVVVRINSDSDANYRSSATAWRGDGSIAQAATHDQTAYPRSGMLGNFSPGVMKMTFIPRSMTSTGFVSWTGEGWANLGQDSATVRTGGRWSGPEQQIQWFLVRTSELAHAWQDGTRAELYGYR